MLKKQAGTTFGYLCAFITILFILGVVYIIGGVLILVHYRDFVPGFLFIFCGIAVFGLIYAGYHEWKDERVHEFQFGKKQY
ncbi:hypothetical protein KKA27_00600 [Patescibacteria group bacterium]|nr:hypothetical protein [Patescibacteria group bacterium]MBU2633357.1 hypothetical protein [Patescibacteria group bacterium]